MTWVIENCWEDGFVASRLKIREQIVLTCAKDFWHNIEQKEMISWGALSPVTRRGCSITFWSLSKQARSDDDLKKQHCGEPRLVFVLGKFLQRFIGITEAYYSLIFSRYGVQLMLSTTANCLMKWYCLIDDESIRPHDKNRPHTTALIQVKLDKIHWKTQEHPPYSPDLSPRDYHMFGPIKELGVITSTATMM